LTRPDTSTTKPPSQAKSAAPFQDPTMPGDKKRPKGQKSIDSFFTSASKKPKPTTAAAAASSPNEDESPSLPAAAAAPDLGPTADSETNGTSQGNLFVLESENLGLLGDDEYEADSSDDDDDESSVHVARGTTRAAPRPRISAKDTGTSTAPSDTVSI